MILKGYIFSVSYAFLCLALALLAYKLGMPKKYSRKMVHVLVGAEWIILSHYMGATYHFLIVCLFFTLFLGIAHFKNLMPMISSESDNAPGTVYYAVAMSIMATVCLFVPKMMLPFGIGVFATSVGDGLAGIVGQLVKRANPRVFKNKTLFGFLANALASAGAALVFKQIFTMNLTVWQCIVLGLFSAGLELITPFGLDNIATTVGVSLLAYLFVNVSAINSYFVPILLTPYIIALVLEKKVLTTNGLILALFLDLVISLTFGNFGFTLLLSFLVGSVVVDKFKKIKVNNDDITKKGECRDAVQVIANGLIPMVMALMFSGTFRGAFIVGYVASLAEAFADTAASGFGAFSDKTYDIFKGRKIKKGLSGGVSLIGTLAALIGSFFIPAIAIAFGVINLKILFITAAAAFIGAMFDTMLGSLLQIKYECTVCGELTERDFHCKKRTKRYSGFEFFDNDVVNLTSGLFASLVAIGFFVIFF